MTDHHLSTLQKEWLTLQNQYDSYEKCSLAIKLLNVIITTGLIFLMGASYWALPICSLLWLQDGIWKTFQYRMAIRIESIEHAIREALSKNERVKPTTQGMQFNTHWAESRPSIVGLVGEYITQALKPTVAYPHAVLLMIIVAKTCL